MAAILIIMMMAWVIIDAGQGARDKVELQAQADTAAYSQASVRARAMNMIAYSNVSKRSIVGIISMYMGMYYGYTLWVAWRWSKCKWYRPDICIDAAINSAMLLVETFGDFRQVTGSIFFGLFGSGGSTKRFHREDMKAIDNYQQYMMALTPWWGYSEAAVRGLRTGASAIGTFPAPAGRLRAPINNLVSTLRGAMGSVGLGGFFSGSGREDRLPWIRPWGVSGQSGRRDGWGNPFWPFGSRWDLVKDGMYRDAAYMAEHLANSYQHKRRSSMGAATWRAYGYGMASFPLGYLWTTSQMGRWVTPLVLENASSAADWQTTTSNMVFAYGNRPERFGEERNKYSNFTKDYSHQLGALDEFGYKNAGDWSMARAEISYQDGDTNPFRPSWTARMRPVALPSEWQNAGFDMNQAYHDVIPFLGLTGLIGSNFGGITSAMADFANMERQTRSFGHSTIEGIAK